MKNQTFANISPVDYSQICIFLSSDSITVFVTEILGDNEVKHKELRWKAVHYT